jgi:hypothetical protein
MSDSWYARALQRASGQQPAPQPRYAPAQAPTQWHDHRPLSTPQQQPAVPDEMLPPEMRWAQKLTNAARNAITNGQAHKTDREPCPQCGSPQYFSRATTNKRMPPPAPHCYNCGYNDGMFDQGLESSWVGAQP